MIYTGRKAGDLPGYDAKKAGALDIDELYGILTRFFIDEYPSTRHYGFGMGGRRPAEVYKEIMKNREAIGVIDTNLRRIHLGWKDEVTPTHEGVRVFSGIWFNSGALQKDEKCRRRKVQVWVDPDDINRATVLIPGVEKPVEVFLQNSAFADLTLAEALEVMAMWRRENPDVTNIHEDRLARVRRERFDSQRRIGVERRLPRSYSTIEECRKKGKAVFAGTRILRAPPHPGTTPVGSLADRNPGGHVFQLGSGSKVIDADAEDITSAGGAAAPSHDVPETPTPTDEPVPTAKPAATPRQRTTSRPSAEPLPRPTIRKLE